MVFLFSSFSFIVWKQAKVLGGGGVERVVVLIKHKEEKHRYIEKIEKFQTIKFFNQ